MWSDGTCVSRGSPAVFVANSQLWLGTGEAARQHDVSEWARLCPNKTLFETTVGFGPGSLWAKC